jgi:hypothetical protein
MKHNNKQTIEWHRECVSAMKATRSDYLRQVDSLMERADRLTGEIKDKELAIRAAKKKGVERF